MERATRPLTEPRTSRGLRRRLLRHHLPLALASAAVLVLFLSLPRFDASKYAQGDIFSATFPRDFPTSQTGQHGGQTGPMQQGGGHQPPQQQGGGHRPPQQQGGGHQPPQQGEGQAPSVSPSGGEVEERSFRRQLTTGTGYIALVLLALTLLIGPANLLLRRRNPVSSYLRRDVGAWTALFSGVHVTVASGEVPFDRAFIDAMVPHHQGAIEMATEAKEAGLAQPELVKIADDIIATQQAEIDQMLEWREQWFGSREREPEAAALEVLGLSAAEAGMEHSSTDLATVDDVDQAFAGMMIGHHTGAIRMAELAKQKAGHDEVKTLAGDIIASQQREIDIMEAYFQGAHG